MAAIEALDLLCRQPVAHRFFFFVFETGAVGSLISHSLTEKSSEPVATILRSASRAANFSSIAALVQRP